MQPIEQAFKTAREMNPVLGKVGVAWNAAEANSEAQVKLARKVCAELGIEYLTLFAFSSENWRRPETEISLLMDLLRGELR